MPKYNADEMDAGHALGFFEKHGIDHLRVRRRADLLTLESGPADDPFAHARLRRVAVSLWRLEMPEGRGWAATPVRGQIDAVLTTLVEEFGWTLEPLDEDPERT